MSMGEFLAERDALRAARVAANGGRLYRAEGAPLCHVCRGPMVAALGMRAHPCCAGVKL